MILFKNLDPSNNPAKSFPNIINSLKLRSISIRKKLNNNFLVYFMESDLYNWEYFKNNSLYINFYNTNWIKIDNLIVICFHNLL